MENKYYTPEIEEFCVGFEYESRIAGYDDEWTKETIYAMFRDGWESNIDDVLAMYEDGGDEFRVKHLDSSDIESLGFHLDPIRSYFNYRNSFSLINEPYKLSLDHIQNENKIILRGHKVDYPTKTLFEGIIKNLSELKKLLKQTKNYE